MSPCAAAHFLLQSLLHCIKNASYPDGFSFIKGFPMKSKNPMHYIRSAWDDIHAVPPCLHMRKGTCHSFDDNGITGPD